MIKKNLYKILASQSEVTPLKKGEIFATFDLQMHHYMWEAKVPVNFEIWFNIQIVLHTVVGSTFYKPV